MTDVVGCRGNTITLSGGGYFDFAGGPSPIRIQDISAGLSTCCRFGGQLRRGPDGRVQFYSVAQHSVLVARMVEAVDPAQAFAALMHDASEGYTGDMMKPLKLLCPDFQAVEKQVERWIALVFGLPLQVSPEIKRADLRALRTEQRDLMEARNGLDSWSGLDGYEPHPDVIVPLTPAEADELFLDEFVRLAPRAIVLNQGAD